MKFRFSPKIFGVFAKSENKNISIDTDNDGNPLYKQDIITWINDELEQLCKDSNASYLDISLLGKSNYFLESTYTINDAGHQYLGNKIYQCAIDEIC